MILLERYLAKNILSAIGLVVLVLTGLESFILFVNQLDDLGRGSFGLFQALAVVCLELPYQVYLFFPVASLLGALLGLGFMANHRELIVMRAAGMSLIQITGAVLKTAFGLILLVSVLGEILVPRLMHYAAEVRLQAISNGQALRTARGVWLHYRNDFIQIGTVVDDNTLQHVFQFRFDAAHHLVLARTLEQITYQKGHWEARGVAQTEFTDKATRTRHLEVMPWDVTVKPALFKMSNRDPDEMSLPELYQSVREQKRSRQKAVNYELAFWQRIIQPLTTLVMMVLAIPFIFGPLRSSTMGAKFLLGATAGFGFYLLNRLLGPISQVFSWPPVAAALLPTLFFALLGFYLLRRTV